MEQKIEKLKKPAKVILAVTLILVGFLFITLPVASFVIGVYVGAVVLVIAGAAEFIYYAFFKKIRSGAAFAILSSIFMVFLGALLIAAYPLVVTYLPLIFAIWLLAFGTLRLVQGIRRSDAENRSSIIAIGVFALVSGVFALLMHWAQALDLLSILVAAISLVYGFLLLMGALIKPPPPKTDKEIADEMNAPFYEMKRRLKGKK